LIDVVAGPAEKNSPKHLKKQSGNLNDTRNLEGSRLGESGSQVPESKKAVGGTAEGSKGGNGFATGNPRLTEKVLNPHQKKAKGYATRSENGGADPSAGTQC
jgi:hypothetical protein